MKPEDEARPDPTGPDTSEAAETSSPKPVEGSSSGDAPKPADAVAQADGPDASKPADAKPADADAKPADAAAKPADADAAAKPADADAAAKPADADAKPADADATEKKGSAEKAAPAPSRAQSARQAGLYRSLRSRRPVNGIVEKVIKGGYEIRLGKTRGFCPHSQFDVARVEDPEQHVGKTYPFRITQLRRGGEDVVVSRRALLEQEQIENAKAVRATLVAGSVMEGRVAGVADFGAFVDLGAGVKGLVHISELSHSRVTRAADVVKLGDRVRVRILELDDSRGRISLSIRQAEEDPWAGIGEKFQPAGVAKGTVRRLTDFGAFVELAPGIEGLASAGEFPPSRRGWNQELAPGDEKDWLVMSVDVARRRIALAPTVEGQDPSERPALEVGQRAQGKIQRLERFGVFVWLGPGRVGLMPNVLTGLPRGADMARNFLIGDDIEVEVVEVDPDGRKLRLGRPGVAAKVAESDQGRRGRGKREDDERDLPRRQPPPSADQGSFGSILADKLKAALGDS